MTGTRLASGNVVGRYVIGDFLGAGGMGQVYRAFDPVLDRLVALKILPAHLTADPRRVQRFTTEARAASAVNHPAIVSVFEVGQASCPDSGDPVHFISMELIEGMTLEQWLQDGPLLDDVLERMTSIAQGVGRVHQHGIIHRDLKPDNIMITRKQAPKILDFGLAKLVEPERSGFENDALRRTPPTLTQPATILGTLGFMSPEQVEGAPLDHRSDIFSLGCILYAAITGTPAFSGSTTAETLHAIVHREPPPIDDPALHRIVMRCLAKDPDRRYDSALDLAYDLTEYRSLTFPVSPAKRAAGLRKLSRSALIVLITAGLLGIPAMGLIEWAPGRLEKTLQAERMRSADLSLQIEERDRTIASKDEQIERLEGENDRLEQLRADLESSYRTFLSDVTRDLSGSESERQRLSARLSKAEEELQKVEAERNLQVRTEEVLRELDAVAPTRVDQNGITMTIPGTIFSTARITPSPQVSPAITAVAAQMLKYPNFRARIEGHADSNGNAEENLAISKNRAIMIRNLLVEAGVESSRITTIGHGEMMPLFSNDSERGRILNRRIAIVLTVG